MILKKYNRKFIWNLKLLIKIIKIDYFFYKIEKIFKKIIWKRNISHIIVPNVMKQM